MGPAFPGARWRVALAAGAVCAYATNVFQLGALALIAAGVAPSRATSAAPLALIVVGLTAVLGWHLVGWTASTNLAWWT